MITMVQRFVGFFRISLIFVSAVTAAEETWTLVEQGRPAAIIVLPASQLGSVVSTDANLVAVQFPEPDSVAHAEGDIVVIEDENLAAAQLLVDHFREMSGAELAIRRENELKDVTVEAGRLVSADGPDTYLLVGAGDLARQLGVYGKDLGAGGIRVKTLGNAVVLIGGDHPSDPRAVRYAAVVLLEALGCRYLWPGELGKVVPKRETIAVSPMNISFTPPIGQRRIRWRSIRKDASKLNAPGLERLQLDLDAWQKQVQALMATPSPCNWRLWHGLGGDLGLRGTHSGAGTHYAANWRAMLDAHPEWFSEQTDGTRSYLSVSDFERYRLCKSNPELIDWVAQSIITYISTNPGLKSVSLSPNDGGYSSFCMCETCKRLDPLDAPEVSFPIFAKQGESKRTRIPYPSLTDRMIWYWSQVAERVVKVHPDVRFGIDAYSIFRTPPVRERPHPNLVVRYVSNLTSDTDKEEWLEWRERGIQAIYWRPNLFWGSAKSGRIYLHTASIADAYSFAAANGTLAVDVDSILDHWALEGLNYYVAARFNWDPERKLDVIVDDYCQAGFGAGAESIGRYFRFAELTAGKRLNTDEELVVLRGYLNAAAEETAADPVIQARIAFLRTGFNFHHLHTVLNRMAEAKEPVDRERAQRLLNLNYIMMRDIAQNHSLVYSTPFLMYRSGGLAHLGPIGGRGFQAAPEVLERAEGRSLTGYENSLEELFAVYGLTDEAAASSGKTDQIRVKADVDEEGRAIEI